ncbi:hypothetical protein [Natronobiforma cellulositropha]|uniref:hypothetical protein n=1 Tax=Natronobiforma cellulositropha TaxID=1679076 RepID=UPI0021D60E41|nr:hypothetical protein [Natronobiforma cellulositropha]
MTLSLREQVRANLESVLLLVIGFVLLLRSVSDFPWVVSDGVFYLVLAGFLFVSAIVLLTDTDASDS